MSDLDPKVLKEWVVDRRKTDAEFNEKADAEPYRLKQIQRIPIDSISSSGKMLHPDFEVLDIETEGNGIYVNIAVPVKTYLKLTDDHVKEENWWGASEDREFDESARLRFIICKEGESVPKHWKYAGAVRIGKLFDKRGMIGFFKKQTFHIFWETTNR